MSKRTEYERFLYSLYKDLYVQAVHATARKNNISEEEAARKFPGFQERIRYYLERMQTLFEIATTDQQKAILKGIYFERLVIKKENLPQNMADAEKESKISQQKKTLGPWLDYLLDVGINYPNWFKYWLLREIVNLGYIDELTGKYTKRSPYTYEPFLDFDQELIDFCARTIIPKVEKANNPKETRRIANEVRFKTLLLDYQKELAKKKKRQSEGKWVKYEMGSAEDAKKLYDSLQGKGTGWCTEHSLGMAQSQVKSGDFYVYYTKDQNEKYTVPRIAIRLNGKTSLDGGEIRGIDASQNLEEEMVDILEKKLRGMTFLDPRFVKENLKKIKEMRLLEKIRIKTIRHQLLTAEELLALYTGTFGFGHAQSTLQERIIIRRNIQEDWRRIQEMGEDAIGLILMNRKILDKNGLKITNHDIIESLIRHRRIEIVLQYAKKEILLPHKEEIRSLLKKDKILLTCMSPEIQIWYLTEIIEAIQENPRYLPYIHEEVQVLIEEDLIQLAIQNMELYDYLSPRILASRKELYTDNFWKRLEEKPEKYASLLKKIPKPIQLEHQDKIGNIIKKDPFYIRFVSEEIMIQYPKIVTTMIIKDPEFIKYIPTKVFEQRREIIIEAVKQGEFAIFYYAPASLKKDKGVLLELVQKQPRIIAALTPNELLNLGLEFLLSLVRTNVKVLRDLPGSIQVKYPILIMEAVANTPDALQYVSENFKEEQNELYQNLLKMYPQPKKDSKKEVEKS